MRQTLLSLLADYASRAEETAIVHWRGLRISRWSYGRLAATAYQFARELQSRNIDIVIRAEEARSRRKPELSYADVMSTLKAICEHRPHKAAASV